MRLAVVVLLLLPVACGTGQSVPQPVEVVDIEPLEPQTAGSDAPEADETPPPKAPPPKPVSSASRAAAQKLFMQGRKLMHQGKYVEACPKFEQSLQHEPSIGGLFNLARCEELLGNTAKACRHYTEVADLTSKRGQKARERVARDTMKRLNCP